MKTVYCVYWIDVQLGAWQMTLWLCVGLWLSVGLWRWQQWNSCGPAAGWLGEDIPGAWNFVKGMRKKCHHRGKWFFFLKTRFALTIGFSSFMLFSKNEIADYWWVRGLPVGGWLTFLFTWCQVLHTGFGSSSLTYCLRPFRSRILQFSTHAYFLATGTPRFLKWPIAI